MAPHCSTLVENPMDGGAWKAAVHGVAECWTRLSDFTFTMYWIVSQANEWEDYSKYFEEGTEISRNWTIVNLLVFDSPA